MAFIRVQKLVRGTGGNILSGSAAIKESQYIKDGGRFHSRQIVRERLGKVIWLSADGKSGIFLSPQRGLVSYDSVSDSFDEVSRNDERLSSGSGLARICNETKTLEGYKDELKPTFNSTPTQFQTVIYASPTDANVGDHDGDVSEIKLTERQQVILNIIKESPSITAKQMSETLSVSPRTVERDLSALKEKGVLKREGKDNDGVWIIVV